MQQQQQPGTTHPTAMSHPIELLLQYAAATDTAVNTTTTTTARAADYGNTGTYSISGGGGNDSAPRPSHSQQQDPGGLARPPRLPSPFTTKAIGTAAAPRVGGAGSPATTADAALSATATTAGESSPASPGNGHDRDVVSPGACPPAAGADVFGGDEGETVPAAALRVAELEAELRDARDRAKEAEKASREKEEANGERGGS